MYSIQWIRRLLLNAIKIRTEEGGLVACCNNTLLIGRFGKLILLLLDLVLCLQLVVGLDLGVDSSIVDSILLLFCTLDEVLSLFRKYVF